MNVSARPAKAPRGPCRPACATERARQAVAAEIAVEGKSRHVGLRRTGQGIGEIEEENEVIFILRTSPSTKGGRRVCLGATVRATGDAPGTISSRGKPEGQAEG